jgi:hypothetical protein
VANSILAIIEEFFCPQFNESVKKNWVFVDGLSFYLFTMGHFIFGYQYLISSVEIEAIIFKKSKLKSKWRMLWLVAVLSAFVYLVESIYI